MDYDLPEELADYLPKQRQGFQMMNQRRPAPAKPPKQRTTGAAPKKVQTKAPANPPPKKTSIKPRTETTTISKGDKTIKTEKITTADGTKKVQTVYPNKKGKILSKVPENKWKEVRAGPREDPSVVRTKEEEIQIFLKYINDYRIKNNLNPLELSEELSQIADVHNTNMMEGKTAVGHEGFKDRTNQITKKFYLASENCAMYVGPREHLLTLFENLCRSPVHNKNLLGNFDTIGLALGKNAENMWYVTQFFVRFNRTDVKNDS